MADADYAAIINDARAAIADGVEPDGDALAERIRELEGDAAAETKALQQLERVLSIHRARGALARKPAQPADFACWQRDRITEADINLNRNDFARKPT